jgi:hypothetical protein
VINKPDSEERPPTYGALSIAFPVGGFLLSYAAAKMQITDSWGFGALLIFLGIMPMAFLAGFVCALQAFARKEICRILPVLGMILNLGPVVWFLSKLK